MIDSLHISACESLYSSDPIWMFNVGCITINMLGTIQLTVRPPKLKRLSKSDLQSIKQICKDNAIDISNYITITYTENTLCLSGNYVNDSYAMICVEISINGTSSTSHNKFKCINSISVSSNDQPAVFICKNVGYVATVDRFDSYTQLRITPINPAVRKKGRRFIINKPLPVCALYAYNSTICLTDQTTTATYMVLLQYFNDVVEVAYSVSNVGPELYLENLSIKDIHSTSADATLNMSTVAGKDSMLPAFDPGFELSEIQLRTDLYQPMQNIIGNSVIITSGYDVQQRKVRKVEIHKNISDLSKTKHIPYFTNSHKTSTANHSIIMMPNSITLHKTFEKDCAAEQVLFVNNKGICKIGTKTNTGTYAYTTLPNPVELDTALRKLYLDFDANTLTK